MAQERAVVSQVHRFVTGAVEAVLVSLPRVQARAVVRRVATQAQLAGQAEQIQEAAVAVESTVHMEVALVVLA